MHDAGTTFGIPATRAATQPVQSDASWRRVWFRRFWLLGLTLLVLSPGRNFGLGNTNPIERSVFLIALTIFIWGKPIRKWGLGGLLLMGLAIVTSGAITNFPEFEWQRLAMAAVALITMLGFLTVSPREDDALFILKSITWLPALTVLFSIVLYAAAGQPLMSKDHTGASRLGGAALPAFLAASCYASVVASGYLFSIKNRPIELFIIATSLVISMMTGSRTATVCAAASVIPFIFPAKKSNVFKILLLLYGTTGLVILLVTAGDQLIQRFLSGSTSGRELMWSVLQAAAARYPLFGIGFGHHGALIPESITRLTGTAAAHNEILRLRVELGIAGLAIFCFGWTIYWLRFTSKYMTPTMLHVFLVGMFTLYSTTDNTLFLTNTLLILVAIGLGTPILTNQYHTASAHSGGSNQKRVAPQ